MVTRQYKQVQIDFLQAEQLPEMDQGLGMGLIDSGTDLYFKMEYGGQKYRTKTTEQKEKVAVVDQFWKIPIEWPPQSNALVIRAYDEDTAFDELIGTIILRLDQLIKEP